MVAFQIVMNAPLHCTTATRTQRALIHQAASCVNAWTDSPEMAHSAKVNYKSTASQYTQWFTNLQIMYSLNLNVS